MLFNKQKINNVLRKWFGLELNRFRPGSSRTAQVISSLEYFGVDLVLDVGANQGQFASEMRGCGYRGNILSFEPLSKAHGALRQASKGDAKWDVFPRCAVGSRNGEGEINISDNSVSSSLLPRHDNLSSAEPASSYVGKEAVSLVTLDSVAMDLVGKFKNPFLKIDVQGFEWNVLDGARNTLPKMRGILLELSLVPLYKGQHLWKDIIARLEGEGFALWALQPGFTDPHNGRTLQVDGLFFREQEI